MDKKIKEITANISSGIIAVYNGERYKKYLEFCSKLHKYSLRNTMLIYMQYPTATAVASFKSWQNMGRYVKKGEKGIEILVPIPRKTTKINKDGEEVEYNYTTYRGGHVFDISQTDGKEVPTFCDRLKGNAPSDLFYKFRKLYPIEFTELDGQNGLCDYKKIYIQEGMSDLQTIKTIIHEVAHYKYHNPIMSKIEKELQAESIAYTVCSYFGLDTSDYSFEYLASWSKGKEVELLEKNLETIQKASAEIIKEVS